MNPYLILYLGGAAAVAFNALASASFRWSRLIFTVPLLLLGAALWPLVALMPFVQWLAVKYGWFGATEVRCPACSSPGIARYYPDAVVPPGGWCVVIVSGPGEQSSVLLVCSPSCAAYLKRDFEWVEG